MGDWDELAKEKGCESRSNWVDSIVNFMNDRAQVYTDLSFYGVPVTRRNIKENYKSTVLEKINWIKGKVLLGSDWYMSRMQCKWTIFGIDFKHGFRNTLME